MKISFDKQVELLRYGFGELEEGNRPPFILCDIEAVYEDLGQLTIAENGFYQELDSKTYYLINTYGNIGTVSGEPSGNVTWLKNQVPTEEIQKNMEIFNTDDIIMFNDFAERKAVELMTFEEYQEKIVNELKAEKINVAFELIVISNAKGEDRTYTINLKVYNELQSQFVAKGMLAFHDDAKTMHEQYSYDEALKLMTDISLSVAYREAKYDVFITRAVMCTQKEQLAMVKVEQFAAEEQAYIDAIVGGVM